jgi:hypothetical protein
MDYFSSDVPMGWQQESFAKSVVKGVNGQTREGFEEEVEDWVSMLRSLPPYDEDAIRERLKAVDFAVPSGTSYSDLAMAHYRLVREKHEVTRLKHMVKPHYEFLKAANESLEKSAVGVVPGRNEYERKANAYSMIRRFVIALVQVKNLLDLATDVEGELQFAAWRMQNNSKDLENALRSGHSGLTNDGAAFAYEASDRSRPLEDEGLTMR